MVYGFLPCMAFGTSASVSTFFFPLSPISLVLSCQLLPASRGSDTLSLTLIVEGLALAATSFLPGLLNLDGKLLSQTALSEDVHHWKILLGSKQNAAFFFFWF